MSENTYFEPISWNLWKEDKAAFAAALGASFRDTGFAVVSNHPIGDATIGGALDASKAFFANETETKLGFHDPDCAGQRGYTPKGMEHAKHKDADTVDCKEFFHIGRKLDTYDAVMGETPSVDGTVPGFDAATYALWTELEAFGRGILSAIALHLGMDEQFFEEPVARGDTVLRLLHYPPQVEAPPPGSIRAAEHEDISVITCLLGAEEAGLQAKHRSGVWLDVSPPPGSIVLNVGDSLQRLTGGALPSTTHRVINPSPERAMHPRYSSPLFLHFNPDFVIDPSVVPNAPNPEPPISARDYLMERLTAIGLVNVPCPN